MVVLGDFEWDDRKAATNLRKHGVSFEEALSALADPAAITAPDLYDSDRSITIGASRLLRVLFVVHTEAQGSGRIRIISARKASAAQRKKYEKG
ncbi:MAG: BrnT family toxin [Myxococcales bacterium]|nr:MAG: BrnT family toxin [Myxococcales bacterium]